MGQSASVLLMWKQHPFEAIVAGAAAAAAGAAAAAAGAAAAAAAAHVPVRRRR